METEKKKVSILLSIARQVEGDRILINILKSHTNSDKLYRYLRESDLPQCQRIADMDCVIEYGIIEDIEVECDEGWLSPKIDAVKKASAFISGPAAINPSPDTEVAIEIIRNLLNIEIEEENEPAV